MLLQESGEMYLETIYVLTLNSAFVRAVDVSDKLGYSKPSVSRAMGLLKNGGYINIAADGNITLTEIGKETAEKIFVSFLEEDNRISLRCMEHSTSVDELKSRMKDADIEIEAGCYSEEALRVSGMDSPERLPGFFEGAFYIQD